MATLNKLTEEKYPGMVKSIEVGPLTEQETKIFVEENLKTLSGIKNKITNKRIKQFFKITAGDIATVNRHMTDFFSDKSTKSANILRNTGVAAGVFFASVLIVFIILSQDFKSAPVQVAGLESRDKAIQELRVEPILDSEVPSYTLNVSRQEINATSLRKLELTSDEDDLNNASIVVDKVIVAPKILNVKTKKDFAHIESNLSDVDKVKQKAKSPKFIATKDKSIFTIQILASNNQAKIEKFILIHNLAGKAEVHHINRQGLGWFVLTYGEFTNRQYAKEALRKLPFDIQKFKPWVRNTADL
jgi:DamX protein